MKLYTAKQTRALDKIAILQQFSKNGFALMENAGLAVFNIIEPHYSKEYKFIIFCGQGNNGGDGFVVAYLAAKAGYCVTVLFLGLYEKLTEDSKRAFDTYKEYIDGTDINLHIIKPDFTDSFEQIINSKDNLIFIDALFGTGLNKIPSGIYKAAIEYINKQKNNNTIYAIDIPSGMQADTGVAYEPTVKADYTVSFIAMKQGLLTNNGPDYTGELLFEPLGISKKIYDQVENESWLITGQWLKDNCSNKLGKRPKNSHKYQFGHVLVVGGDISMPGAAVMAGSAALRAGAGLVSVVTNLSHSSEVSQHQLELMVLGVDDNLDSNSNLQDKITELLEKTSVIVLGPGLGQSKWSKNLFNFIIEHIVSSNNYTAVVIDADGLNLLSEYVLNSKNIDKINKIAHKLVLTPHPGEANKLLHEKLNISDDRFAAITMLCDIYKSTVILKGVGSLIKNPNNKVALCSAGNPGMASAGMGDILAGVVAALMANGLDNYFACCLAVYIHATAGDNLAKTNGERGMLATDLLLEIRRLVNNIDNNNE